MFLVLDRTIQASPAWLDCRDVVLQYPSRLVIPRWRVEPQAEWLVTGPAHLLDTLAGYVRGFASKPKCAGTPGAPRLAYVDHQPPQRSWWRWLLRFPAARPGKHRLSAWLHGLPAGDAAEHMSLANIADALEADVDVLVFDRVLRHVRGEVRFRVATDVRRAVAECGLAIVVLAETDPEGWIAVSRRAVLERGVWHDVHGRTPAATGSD